ncbi:MAG: aminotransferase class III-fold pyridoxal phosphate-dependent enzyme, partial [Candidatus Omnitrophota bacterium]
MEKNKEELINEYKNYVMPTYSLKPRVFVRGKGTTIWDSEGREYLDFFPGWAVSGLGHSHPLIRAALRSQAKKILHVPNNY